jgi:hypothetical protein
MLVAEIRTSDRVLISASREVTYSFFFFLLMQADSLFLIIRCCRFMFLNCNTERERVRSGS